MISCFCFRCLLLLVVEFCLENVQYDVMTILTHSVVVCRSLILFYYRNCATVISIECGVRNVPYYGNPAFGKFCFDGVELVAIKLLLMMMLILLRSSIIL